jgi:hypothetical protein
MASLHLEPETLSMIIVSSSHSTSGIVLLIFLKNPVISKEIKEIV